MHHPRLRQHLDSEKNRLVRIGVKLEPERPKRQVGPPAVPRYLLMQHDRQKLFDQIWSQPTQIVAKEYGVSDVALAKLCRKLYLPKPGRGYWAKRAVGKRAPGKPPLPAIREE